MGILADFRITQARFGVRSATHPFSLWFGESDDCCIYVIKGREVYFEYPDALAEPVICPHNTIIITTSGKEHGFRTTLEMTDDHVLSDDFSTLSKDMPLLSSSNGDATVITQIRVPQRLFINFLRVSPVIIVPNTARETVSRVHDLFHSINSEIFSIDEDPTALQVIERLTEMIVIVLMQYWLNQGRETDAKHAAKTATPDDPSLKLVLDAVHAEPHRNWTLDNMATEAGLRRSTFCMRFKQIMRVSPMQYLTSLRMSIAASRMRDADKGLAEIAFHVGYRSEAAFNRAFRREFTMTPGRYRWLYCAAR